MPKFIFVTGGVMSGLGKGTIAASTGRLLKNSGVEVTAVKIDPYLNVDAGTMSPYEHGEVFVLKDGAEVDLDLGNYERFLDVELDSDHNITTGKVYREVIESERQGKYLGKTVQIIPHITDEIKRRVEKAADGSEVCIAELGGTVGDIEGMPFFEALRQFRDEVDSLLIHATLIPTTVKGEQKTKPTQHSVKELRQLGLKPDVIVGRSEKPLEKEVREKISLFCDVPSKAVVSAPDVEDVYEVPLVLEEEKIDDYITSKLEIDIDQHNTEWREAVTKNPEKTTKVALVGKYDFEDAYHSVHEALKHAGIENKTDIEVIWIDSQKPRPKKDKLRKAEAIVVPGGFGERGVEGKISAINYARKNNTPFLGLCFGFQMSIIEYARNVAGLDRAYSTEIGDGKHPVVDLLPDQEKKEEMGGTMRLGDKKTKIKKGTLAYSLYKQKEINERHRHRYEVNPKYVDTLKNEGLVFSGKSKEGLVEILELPNHPFFLATQFHPEFRSRPTSPSSPFVGFIEKAIEK